MTRGALRKRDCDPYEEGSGSFEEMGCSLQNEWITKSICAHELGGLDLTQLKQRLNTTNNATEADHWNLAKTINCLVDTPIRFTDDVMKEWDGDQTDRWLKSTGFPYELGDDGEDMYGWFAPIPRVR